MSGQQEYVYRIVDADGKLFKPSYTYLKGLYSTLGRAKAAISHASPGVRIQRAEVTWEDVE